MTSGGAQGRKSTNNTRAEQKRETAQRREKVGGARLNTKPKNGGTIARRKKEKARTDNDEKRGLDAMTDSVRVGGAAKLDAQVGGTAGTREPVHKMEMTQSFVLLCLRKTSPARRRRQSERGLNAIK